MSRTFLIKKLKTYSMYLIRIIKWQTFKDDSMEEEKNTEQILHKTNSVGKGQKASRT